MITQTIRDKALAATKGTKLGAIIRAHYGVEREVIPRFEGKASVTSDGFAMCNFVDRQGEGHMGAFVGDMSEVTKNFNGLAAHLGLTGDDHHDFVVDLLGWIGRDWRGLAARRAS